MSLTNRIIAMGSVGLAVLALVLFQGTEWAVDSVAEQNTGSYLSAYADLLVPAIRINAGVAQIDSEASIVDAIPRDWQINQDGAARQRSSTLKSWVPIQPRSDADVQFRFNDADGREIVALQRDYAFPNEMQLTLVFGMDADLADRYAATQRSALRNKLKPLFYGAGLFAILLLMGLVGVVLWPLKRLQADIVALDQGRTGRLGDQYPAELSALTGRLNALLSRHETSLQRYRQFASNLSHAIKTPLTSLRLQTDSDDIRSGLDSIDAIVERNLARVRIAGSDSGSFERIEVETRLDALARTYRKLTGVTIDLDVASELSFDGDAQDFVEAIGNILENACRFAREKVAIVAIAGQITIRDDGPGIPSERVADVMQRGTRLDQAASSGTGIGLSIAAEIVEAYGGSIDLRHRDGGGLAVVILIPSLG